MISVPTGVTNTAPATSAAPAVGTLKFCLWLSLVPWLWLCRSIILVSVTARVSSYTVVFTNLDHILFSNVSWH